ncbi:hypothetical protein L7F22_007594 [Adiantum nelumboides]|nr:hypothetical protein [Adiantum nelumboides]
MGFLLNLQIKLNPRRRWNSFYLWRQGYLSLQENCDSSSALQIDRPNYLWPRIDDLVCLDEYEYDDKYVVSCNVNPSDDSFMLTSFDENRISYDVNAGISAYGSKYTVKDSNCSTNYDDSKESTINGADTRHEGCNYKFDSICYKDGSDCDDNYYKDMEKSDYEEDGNDESDLLRGYYNPQEPYLHRKKKLIDMAQNRARGLEGYWQRQAYLHSAYKFTRRKSMCERAKVPVRKLRTAWGMVRGMYAKQSRCMRGKLKSIYNYARFHHTSFLLLSKQYLRYRDGGACRVSFNSTKRTFQYVQQY